MKREAKETRLVLQMLLYLGLAILTAAPVLAQVPVDENGDPFAPLEGDASLANIDDDALPILSGADLEDIVGPVALYPDDLLAIVLPASTYPLQVVQAARFLEQLETDSSLKPDEDWDDAVTALLNYPEVIELMNEDIDWTWRLGEAVVAQQADVVAAIEAFRDKAYAAGNLKSDEYQTVSNEEGVIEIEPVNEDVIYVPYYEPERVVVYQPEPVYHYYPYAYPLYYYPYPAGYSFNSGFFWGVTTAYTIGWWTNHLHVYHHSYWGHPYYGYSYYSNYYYRQPSLHHYNNYYVSNSQYHSNYRYRDGDYWRPQPHGGARPGHNNQRAHYYRDRNRDDWNHGGNHRRGNGESGNRTSGHDIGGQQVRNLDENGDGIRNRGGNNGQRDRNGQNGGNTRDRNGTDDGARHARNRNGNAGALSGNRARGNPGERRGRNSSGSADRNAVQFRTRDASSGSAAQNRRARTSEDLNRSTDLRTSFAAPQQRSSRGTSSRRTASNTPPRPSTRSAASERNNYTAANNSRRPIQTSRPRQASAPRSSQAVRPSSSSPQRAPARTQARNAPQRRASPPSTPQRSESPPSAPQRSAPSSSRSESRQSRASSRGTSQRSDSRSKRH